jgi:lecithin-cholesterol acyltransferase
MSTFAAGFIPYAGNWPGAGLLVGLLFEGLGVTDFSFLPSAAATFETWPSTYFSAAQPAVFGNTLTLVETPERNYTSLDYSELYSDAGLTLAPVLTQKYLGLVTPKMFPEVAVYSFYGSGFSTVVGIVINNLTVGLPYSGTLSCSRLDSFF